METENKFYVVFYCWVEGGGVRELVDFSSAADKSMNKIIGAILNLSSSKPTWR